MSKKIKKSLRIVSGLQGLLASRLSQGNRFRFNEFLWHLKSNIGPKQDNIMCSEDDAELTQTINFVNNSGLF